jgi:MSHA pilin protein MshA
MKVKANQQGFTLIELVVVIVILGILAVTAAPKFIDLTGEARGAVVQAVEGSLNSAADLAHAKALVNGIDSGSLSIAKGTVEFINGYPTAATINILMEVNTATSTGDFVLDSSTTPGTATYTYADAVNGTECQAVYTNALSDARPSITSTRTGC